MLLGAAWGLMFGLAVRLTQPWLSTAWNPTQRALLIAAVVGWTVSILPYLKYPANPPGVGEAETIVYRQALYFGFIGLSIAGTVGATVLHRGIVALQAANPTSRITVPVLYLLYAVGIYLLVPPNPDPVEMPTGLLQAFRAISLAALVVFWLLLGLLYAWQTQASNSVRT
jgi:hypothetical protein